MSARNLPRKIQWNISSEGGERIEFKSILIKDTTRAERERIVARSLAVCGTECEFCNGCDNLGGGRVEEIYRPYIEGEKEIAEIHMEYRAGLVRG